MDLLQRLTDALGVEPTAAEAARARAFARIGLSEPENGGDA
jgi:hypothetical protein